MANRSYLYSLSNRPTSFTDRPETISGLSEWPYEVPFSYRVLMSGEPRLCASLISDGFDRDDDVSAPATKTRLYAISGDFDTGFARLTTFIALVEPMVATTAPGLVTAMADSIAFLEAHRDRHLLLETIELDMMTASEEDVLRASVEREIALCRRAGEAVDALIAAGPRAEALLRASLGAEGEPPLDILFGLRLDDAFDDTADGTAEVAFGFSFWDEALYFALMNRAELEASRTQTSESS